MDSWLTGRPAVDNGVTDGQSPLLTALFLWPDVSLLVTFLGHLPHAFSFLPLACDSKKKMAKGYRRGMTAGGPFFLVTATTTRNVATINRGNENFLVIIGAVNGSPSKRQGITAPSMIQGNVLFIRTTHLRSLSQLISHLRSC